MSEHYSGIVPDHDRADEPVSPPILWIVTCAALLMLVAVAFLAGLWYVGIGPK